jgi:poly(3-hydroxybutyrate) depolymerase
MMYDAYQKYADATTPLCEAATRGMGLLRVLNENGYVSPVKYFEAYCALISLARFTHGRPDYNLASVAAPGRDPVAVAESVVATTPFCNLLRFKRAGAGEEPRVLLVAPMSGHFATLLRGTIRTLLLDHEVYVTDWRNPRDIPLSEGAFELDDFVQHLIDFMRILGPRQHIVAVCQPAVAALAAAAVLGEDDDPAAPASLTLMAGPIDARIAPTKVNEFATSKPIEWFKERVIGVVPRLHAGAGRRVYPGFVQLSAFMSMNMDRHAKSFADLFHHLIVGNVEKAEQIRTFYEEYFAIMDLDAEFYLQTIETVFHKFALAEGKMLFKGRLVNPAAIRRTFLLTVEGEKDDICALGQTLAAQDLCTGLRPYMKSHHMQEGVGHYGVFNGKRWDARIYPVVRNHILASL